ncbi:HAD family hydrolase [Phytohabitans sp. LJ34]|uniref:HAD family hydrolase n=1 Tax=Phytohabitans sp. LJ34 TaxID=3452217 RepID=UPI003F8C050F
MPRGQHVRGILFDSGGVLVGPRGGRWNPRYDFERVVLAHHPEIRVEAFPEAFAAGQRVLDAETTTATRTDYHRAMLRVLGVGEPSAALLRELEAPADGPVLELFPETRRVLDTLKDRGVRMAVVSDNWAGLEAHYRQLDIERYFEGFVISELMGCRKPDPRMYATGSDLLGLAPGDCLFVDDDPALVAAAIDLGYRGVVLLRGAPPPAAVPAVDTLDALPPIVAGERPPSGITGDPAAYRGHNRDHGEGS